MRGKRPRLAALRLLGATAGCVDVAVAVVKAPFQIVGKTVDVLTTSQSEADRNRGRRERKVEAEQARHDRKLAKEKRKAEREVSAVR